MRPTKSPGNSNEICERRGNVCVILEFGGGMDGGGGGGRAEQREGVLSLT